LYFCIIKRELLIAIKNGRNI
jgi:hypothetical protein